LSGSTYFGDFDFGKVGALGGENPQRFGLTSFLGLEEFPNSFSKFNGRLSREGAPKNGFSNWGKVFPRIDL